MYQPKDDAKHAMSGQKVPEITREFVEDYVRENASMATGVAKFPAKGPLSEEDITHITGILYNMVRWYYDQPAGLGGTAGHMLKNDFRKAVLNADTTNLRAIRIYALFLYNIMPQGYIEKAQREL